MNNGDGTFLRATDAANMGLDENGMGIAIVDYDQDGDGVVAEGYDAKLGGTAPQAGDCDDTDSSINPDAEDVSGDGIDTMPTLNAGD